MKKLLKWIITLLSACLGLGCVVGMIEKRMGKKGWVEGHQLGFYEQNVKRPLDIGVSLFALIMLSPIMMVTAILVRVKLGRPILFKQMRAGLGGRIFTIWKFRTMINGSGTDEERLTNFGKMLRNTSVDELPELGNILIGDMSLVGPRPLLVEYLERYSPEQAHRHDVRPGFTGLAQVSGRNELSWEEKFENDEKYVEHITFFSDLRILIKTVAIVVKKKGISSKTCETMEVFTGSEK